MANRTVKDAQTVHGTNPQYLVEKIIRSRIYDSQYWKDQCFALSAELLVDKAMELRYIGGIYGGNIKPCPFLCLTLKMLQIQPEKDIVIEFIKQDDFKYVRALGAYYLRLVHPSIDCYKYLEPLLNDYRKLRIMNRNGQFELTHMDEFVDNLLREERFNDIMLPRIQKRWHHENDNDLEPRISLLDDDLDDLESESDDDDLPPSPPPTPPHSRRLEKDDYHRSGARDERARARSPGKSGSGRSHRDRDKRHRSRSRDRGREDGERKRRRSRSKEKERRHRSPGHHRHKRRDRDRSRDREHRRKDDKERRGDRDKKRDKEKRRHHRRERESSLDLEIAEANALRAKLGMQPLRR